MPEKFYEITIEDQNSRFELVRRTRLIRSSSVVGLESDERHENQCRAFLGSGVVWKVFMSADALAALLGLEIVRATPTQ